MNAFYREGAVFVSLVGKGPLVDEEQLLERYNLGSADVGDCFSAEGYWRKTILRVLMLQLN